MSSFFSPSQQTGFFYHQPNQGLNILMIKIVLRYEKKDTTNISSKKGHSLYKQEHTS